MQITWDPQLTFRLKDQLNLSYDKIDQLRFAFTHHRVGKRLVPRPWVVNPWTGARLNFPQPIAPRTAWQPLVKTCIHDHGLHMDPSGTVAQRSITRVVSEQVGRDMERGYLPSIAEAPKTVVVLGADGFTATHMSMMHVGVSIAPNYKPGIAQQNEINLKTVATSRTDDHWGGLDHTLTSGYYSAGCTEMAADCIAAEYNKMLATGVCPPCPAGGAPMMVDPVACFDLAAARGIRGGRGKCACHVAAEASDRLKVPDLPADCTWPEAKEILDKEFPFLTASTMRADSHTPPAGWDYSMGPWKCNRPGCNVSFTSNAEWVASVKALKKMKKDTSDSGKKALASRSAAYAKLHPTGQNEHEPPILDMDMDRVILDPLHALLLNLCKTLWKYCFGDRMTNSQREAVAEFLSEINCPLDIRAKSDGRDANRKWFTGGVFQHFVEGGKDETKGGLKRNIEAIVDIVFKTHVAPTDSPPTNSPPANLAPPAATAPAPAKKRKAPAAPRARARMRAGGFSAVPEGLPVEDTAPSADSAEPPAESAESCTDSAEPSSAGVPPPRAAEPEDAETASLRERYASHMDLVRLILKAWRMYGLLYGEWMKEWPSVSDDAVKQQRALDFLHRAIDFSEAMKDVSYKKHKSWYVFLTVWVASRQIAQRGDLWAYSTAPIESRGARMKRIVRSCISWRGPAPRDPPRDPESEKSEANKASATRPYESCAMLQLLRSVVAQEQIWQSPHLAGGGLSVSQRRLLATGRATIVKKEPKKLVRMVEDIIDLT